MSKVAAASRPVDISSMQRIWEGFMDARMDLIYCVYRFTWVVAQAFAFGAHGESRDYARYRRMHQPSPGGGAERLP